MLREQQSGHLVGKTGTGSDCRWDWQQDRLASTVSFDWAAQRTVSKKQSDDLKLCCNM
jgi:hypothetical protein